MEFSKIAKQVEKDIKAELFLNNDSSKNLDIILDIVNTINKTLIFEDVLELVLKNAISLTGTERGFIVLKNDEGVLEFKLGMNSETGKIKKDEFSVSQSVVDDVFITGESKFIESAQSDVENRKSKSIFILDLQTILCSPLITSGKKIGVIYVDSKHLHKIKIKEITNMFEILAGQAATAIRNAQLYNAQLAANKSLEESNRQLIIAKEEAEKSDRLKSEFLAQMSHEIRTPIHILMSYSSLIKEEIEGSLDNDMKSSFNAIEHAGKRIIRTTELILNMSEISTGTYEYSESEFDIYDGILSTIYNEYQIKVNKNKIKFAIENNSEQSIVVADKYSVYQIFTQIIDNAVNYTENGEITIFINNSKNNKLEVSVSDTGIGISDEYMPNIFMPFTQEEQGYTRRFEGNGLGLSLVKKYCDLNHAEIDIQSIKGKGTKVLVTF
ncbi:MAG: GAF domain-containing sensor histidine kinase [Melioribacteraceae bacterium]|jgi:signal transduction histidine kinase|nr:GAF domain-containing sensor histidine kinase [Melioribacteraceae bacterium]